MMDESVISNVEYKEDFLREVMYLAENNQGNAYLLLSEPIAAPLTRSERRDLCVSLLVLAREQLSKELDAAPADTKIEISPDPAHSNLMFALRFLLNKDNEFSLLTYFGGLANKNTLLADGLKHVLEAVVLCENNIEITE